MGLSHIEILTTDDRQMRFIVIGIDWCGTAAGWKKRLRRISKIRRR
jgi:hypothetical protein